MRPVARQNEDGTRSTHKMAWIGDPSKKRGNFGVYPTITPKPGKETSTSSKDWTEQTPQQAKQKGELISVGSRKRAEKLAAGSWKTGVGRKESMKEFRNNKKTK